MPEIPWLHLDMAQLAPVAYSGFQWPLVAQLLQWLVECLNFFPFFFIWVGYGSREEAGALEGTLVGR